MANPDTYPINFVILGEPPIASPGPAEVIGAGSPRKWQERAGYGWGGAWLWFTGRQLSEFSIRLTLATDEQWDAYETGGWKAMTDPPPYGTRAGWLPIYHPFLEANGVDKCVILDRGQPTQTDSGLWTIEIKCKQWNKPRLQLAKPATSKANEPQDPRARELAAQADINQRKRAALLDSPTR
jgi:hypothetical protein